MQFSTLLAIFASACAAPLPQSVLGELGKGLVWGTGFGVAAGGIEAAFRVHEKRLNEKERIKDAQRVQNLQQGAGMTIIAPVRG